MGELVISRNRDELGRIAKTMYESRDGVKTEELEYDLAGGPVKNLGRLVQSTGPEGEEYFYSYNASGSLQKITDAEGAETTYQYDPLGRVRIITFPGGGTEVYEYDAFDRVTGTWGRNGEKTSVSYGPLGLYIDAVNPEQALVHIDYNTTGKKIKEIGPRGETVCYFYDDAMGNLIRTTGAEGEDIRFEYDDFGYLTARKIVAGSEVHSEQYTRDVYGRLTGISGEEGYGASYEYDYNGKLRKLVQHGADADKVLREWSYDIEGLPVGEEYELDGITYEKEYTCGLDGTLTKVKNFRGQETGYSYDRSLRLTKIAFPENEWYEYQYDKNARLISMTGSDGHSINYQYDLDGNLVKQTDENGSLLNYTYNKAGELLSVCNNETGNRVDYQYDKVGRIKELTAQGDGKIQYEYDKSGNLVQAVYNFADTITSEYTYDLSSRMRSYRNVKGTGSRKELTDGYLYYYNTFGNIAYETDENGYTTAYEYDGRDRLSKVWYPADRGNKQAQAQEELEALGLTPEKKVQYTKGIPGPEAEIAAFYSQIFGEWEPGPTTFLARIGYTGTQVDVESADYHFAFREYDPLTAQFTTEDLVKDGEMWYALCGQNAVNYIDPLGLVINLAQGSTERDIEAFEKAICYLKTSPTANRLITFLEKVPVNITVNIVNSVNSQNYKGIFKTVNWDPYFTIRTPKNETISSALILLHELGEAFIDLNGISYIVEQIYRDYFNIPENANLSEIHKEAIKIKINEILIDQIEKPVAIELSEPYRDNYLDWAGGKYGNLSYREVTDPTLHTNINTGKEEIHICPK